MSYYGGGGNSGGGGTKDHRLLAGRIDADQHPAAAVSVAPIDSLGAEAGTVQQALEALAGTRGGAEDPIHHAAMHKTGGADALTPADIGAQTNMGITAIGGASQPLAATASNGSGTAVALANHAHPRPSAADIGASTLQLATTGTPTAPGVAAMGNATTAAPSNHIHPAQAVPAAANIDTAALNATVTQGIAGTFARSDHRHAIPAIPAAANIATTAIGVAETVGHGTAATFARSDHRHAGPSAAAPGSIAVGIAATAAAAGTAGTVARSDHVHGFPAMFDATAPGTIAVGTAATAAATGSAATAARRDHAHGFPAMFDANIPSTLVFGGTAAAGSSTLAARRDHTHGMPANPVAYKVAAYGCIYSDGQILVGHNIASAVWTPHTSGGLSYMRCEITLATPTISPVVFVTFSSRLGVLGVANTFVAAGDGGITIEVSGASAKAINVLVIGR